MRKTLIILLLIFIGTSKPWSQTANITKGCIPLSVEFDSPILSNYFWDFKDGATANLNSPEHTFTAAGIYNVELREGPVGDLIGIVIINVYEDLVLNIDADVKSGCAPLSVNFTSSIELDDSLSIQSISWSFGDGNSSTDVNPNHVYTTSGSFTISLQVKTNETECDKTMIFPDYIIIESIGNVGFTLDLSSACEAPTSVPVTNNTNEDPTLDYMWDFGNGVTSSSYDPGSISYDQNGLYTVTLSVSNEEGCTEVVEKMIAIGLPKIEMSIPDTVCIGVPIDVFNTTIANNYFWQFDSSASILSSNLQIPVVRYFTSGIHNIEFEAFNGISCKVDTTIAVFVERADATFTVDPIRSCFNPQTIILSANEKNYKQYLWNDSIVGNAEYVFDYLCPTRDSLHINREDTLVMNLKVTTAFGCIDRDTVEYYQRKPYAHFLSSVTSGCAPLEISFVDVSETFDSIVNYTWLIGDGSLPISGLADSISYTYNNTGEYYVRLVIETEFGCIDTSYGIWIEVGEKIIPSYTIDKTEICLHESVTISIDNNDDRIDDWYIYTDGCRFDQCFKNNGATHFFDTKPGLYDISFIVDYNGCFGELNASEKILVQGANADISYMITCDSPYGLMLKNEGIGANKVTWLIDGQEISDADSLLYTFSNRGDYVLTLITEDTLSGCIADTSNTEIFIREPKARFVLPETVCDNLLYTLDAKASDDVDDDCSKGYLWYLPFNRPREVSISSIEHGFPIAGKHDVTLIVEDLHGCRDTLTKHTTSYGINPSIDSDVVRTCLPREITFTNTSQSDTTLIIHQWSFGSSDSIVTQNYSGNLGNNITTQLFLEDAIGCRDTAYYSISLYKPISQIIKTPIDTVCIGTEITILATDFISEGSFLNYNWDFGVFGMSNERVNSFLFENPGTYPIHLSYEEESSGCGGLDSAIIEVIPFPEAMFVSSVDDVDPICHPAQISFGNESITVGSYNVEWFVNGNGPFSNEQVTFAFEKGTHEISMVVESFFGCADTLTRSFELVGPEGSFIVDESEICEGDQVVFTLIDTADVTNWEWDFGDGIIIENENPISHQYDFRPESGSTIASLVLFSAETGCEYIETIPIQIGFVIADFEILDSLNYCAGFGAFQNHSEAADSYIWSVDGNVFSTEENPNNNFGSTGTFEVSLQAMNTNSGCTDELSQVISIADPGELFKIPNVFSPNGDNINDYFNIAIFPGNEEFLEVVTFKIYNRWGNLVYDNQAPEIGWDGNFENKLAPLEVYAYYIEIVTTDCRRDSFKGNITLIR